MVIKLIVKFLLRRKEGFLKLINISGKIYIFSIDKYESTDEYLRKCENALNTVNIQGVDN